MVQAELAEEKPDIEHIVQVRWMIAHRVGNPVACREGLEARAVDPIQAAVIMVVEAVRHRLELSGGAYAVDKADAIPLAGAYVPPDRCVPLAASVELPARGKAAPAARTMHAHALVTHVTDDSSESSALR